MLVASLQLVCMSPYKKVVLLLDVGFSVVLNTIFAIHSVMVVVAVFAVLAIAITTVFAILAVFAIAVVVTIFLTVQINAIDNDVDVRQLLILIEVVDEPKA